MGEMQCGKYTIWEKCNMEKCNMGTMKYGGNAIWNMHKESSIREAPQCLYFGHWALWAQGQMLCSFDKDNMPCLSDEPKLHNMLRFIN